MKQLIRFSIAIVVSIFISASFLQSQNCIVPDNGTGTATLPPIGCQYQSVNPFMIIDGLPPGTTIELHGIYSEFICCDGSCPCSIPIQPGECEAPGGSLGGDGHCFLGSMMFEVIGTGDLQGFTRMLYVDIFSEIHTGPRNPGERIQAFQADYFRFEGELLGDPDFCTFHMVAGTDYGLPSPGQTTLTKLPSGDFAVDSFFDITYQIEFEGCPGSVLEGYMGITTATTGFDIPFVPSDVLELGDAPEMALAYPSSGTTGVFPTCIDEPADGYIAHQEGYARFGPSIDFENEGNAGYCPTFNPDTYNQDECFGDGDAGLIIPDGFTITGPVGSEIVQPCTGASGIALGYACQIAEWGVDIDIGTHNHIPSGELAYVNFIVDWDQDGKWGGTVDCPGFVVPEHVLVNYPIPNPFDGPISNLLAGITFPIGPNSGYVWARFSITDSPISADWRGQGYFEYGETEDYLLYINEDPEEIDWGDAPDGAAAPLYPTLAINNGANHLIDGITFLGADIDSENDGIPDANALGDDNDNVDDEDGVILPPFLTIGQTYTIDVYASVDGLLNAWLDFDINGNWSDGIDQIFFDENLVAGLNNITFTVPSSATTGMSFARFRFDTNGGLGYEGSAANGEVEDYEIELRDEDTYKWEQLPDLSIFGLDVDATKDMEGFQPPHILADDFECTVTGPITNIQVWGSWYLDRPPWYEAPDDVIFTLSIHADIPANPPDQPFSMPGEVLWYRTFQPGEFSVELHAFGLQEGWYDPVNGFYDPFGDTECWLYSFDIDTNFFIQTGTPELPIIYWLDVQAQPLDTDPECRFGWKTSEVHWNDDGTWAIGEEPYNGSWQELLYPTGHELEGQSIDLAFRITGGGPPPPSLDFGDAPDPVYKTLLENNGPRHNIEQGFYLGTSVDSEPNGQPNTFATGDNNDGNNDEIGVVIPSLIPGGFASLQVTLNDPLGAGGMLDPWIDFNMNGMFDQPGEHLCGGTSCVLVPGLNLINFTVPAGTPGNIQTYARFRLSRNGGLMPFGPAPDGEVEDYMVFIHDTIPDAKMHYPQYPDPFGWDVNITYPNVLADDWRCTETGYVEDFHIWVSWLNDVIPEVPEEAIQNIHISIHSDIPADSIHPYSMPGDLLWQKDFGPGEYFYNWYFEGPQGWFDPVQGLVLPENHYNCYRIDIDNFDEPFVQQEGTIYWMDVSIELVGGSGGFDQITVTLDGVDPTILPYQPWTESGVDLMIVDLSGPASYVIDVDRIWLFSAQLNADLSNLPGTVTNVEVDIYDGCGVGCTVATLYEGSSIVDQQSNIVTNAESTLVLANSGGFVPDLVTISSNQGAVIEIRIYFEDSESYQIGWKTSINHWNDDAVFSLLDLGWMELIDPLTEESLDMAFVITGNPVNNLDWGDAPDGVAAPQYPTLAINSGANHVINNLIYLGDTIDAEGNGIPDINALGDDNNNFDDEDGVIFTSPMIPGFNATVDVIASVDGLLNAWIDFDMDGGWAEPGDQIFIDEMLHPNINHLNFNIPANADSGLTYARFRFSTVAGISYTGQVLNGEVEDYEVFIDSPPEKWWVQEPDLSDLGLDVDATAVMPAKYPFNILADDFFCDQTGPISMISIWGSWYHDHYPWFEDPGSVTFTLSIHKDIPADQSTTGYSMPGDVIWYETFGPGQFIYSLFASGLFEGWYDPAIPLYDPLGDTECWKYTFIIDQFEEPFIQQGTPDEPIVYWLDVQATPFDNDPECRFGWKTSPTHWNDDAVWAEGMEPYNGSWNELIYPADHPLAGQSIDLAFEIHGFENPYILVDLQALLEGPYNGTEMNTDLNIAGLLPLNHPYNVGPWTYSGMESVTGIPNSDIVDWVLVELRETPGGPASADGTTKIAQKASFLLRDNSVVALDGMSYLKFYKTITANLYAVIWHRNHLGVMSRVPVIPIGGVYTYDFTFPVGQAYQDGQKDLGGIFGLYGGDGLPNGTVNLNDYFNVWMPEAGTTGYKQGDFNLDTQVDNKDKDDIWVPNLGEGTKVP